MSLRRAVLRIFVSSLWRRRLASALSLFALALGVALGLAVQLIHSAALDEFGRGIRLISGEADLQVIGPRNGFDDALYAAIAQHPHVAVASPVLEIEARLPGRERPEDGQPGREGQTLRVFGVDVFRVPAVTPALMPAAAQDGTDGRAAFALLREDALFLSAAAMARLDLAAGERLAVQAGLSELSLRVAGSVPGAPAGDAFGVMDIAAAQKVFDRVGRLSRIDIRLAQGVSVDAAREALGALVPPGLSVLAPEVAASQAANLSRAYRVNLTMLAAIALLTGAFLVFSTQVLAVVRRRHELAFLRALGLPRGVLFHGLLAEGAVLGLVGGALGVALAYGLTGLAFSLIGGDLGAGYFSGVQPALRFDAGLSLLYLGLGVLAGVGGAWLPAREAARLVPARALRAGDEARALDARPRNLPALGLCALAALLCTLPPLGGVPVAGYAAVVALLAAAVLFMPGAVRGLMGVVGRFGGTLARLAQSRLAAMPGQAVVAGAGIVASVALAVSMAIMVGSFRTSVDDWLAQVLPADLYVRASSASASGFLEEAAAQRVGAMTGVVAVAAVRYDTLRLIDERFPMTLIARPVAASGGLPLVAGADGAAEVAADLRGAPPVWLSEAASDLLRLAPGDAVALPIAGVAHTFRVAGIWRDYARQHGALVVELETYRALSGDLRINDLAVTLAPGQDAGQVAAQIRADFGARNVDVALPGEIRAITLEIFDRTFLVTYLMEAIAVLIGLFGIATTFAGLAASRAREFGMLRHLGLRRRDIARLLALEGALTALIGVCNGTLAGGAIAWVLIEVINRQSFHWSMDLEVPALSIFVFVASLVALAALAARLAGAHAMRGGAVRAVREDW